MNGWTIAFIALSATRVGVAIVNHGKERDQSSQKWNGWTRLWVTAVDVAILWKAGLFN